MSAASMWTAMQAAIAAVTPYQGSDPVASAAYRAAVGQAMCTAIISEQNSPVAWDGTNDRVLDVGQFTKDSFTSATSIPLNIACGDGQIYEIEMVGSFAAAAAGAQTLIQPNNAVPTTNSFDISHIKVGGTTVSGNTLTASADGGFVIGYSSSVLNCKCCVFTSTLTKAVETLSSKCWDTTNGRRLFILNSEWLDTITVWSSLGTIIQPNAWTGQVVCRRVA